LTDVIEDDSSYIAYFDSFWDQTTMKATSPTLFLFLAIIFGLASSQQVAVGRDLVCFIGDGGTNSVLVETVLIRDVPCVFM
jgi:hypothetical protein